MLPEFDAFVRAVLPVVRAFIPLLTAAVLCGCGGGGSDVPPAGGNVTVSGTAQYELPAQGLPCSSGLNFDDISLMPIRQATVQAIDAATDAVLATTVTDDLGQYVLSVAANSFLFIRVRAELRKNGSPAWDVVVRDNTSGDGPLESRALYVLDGSDFDVGGSNQTRNLTATTGWGGSSYTAARAAAPFAILDAVYTAMLLVLTEEPQLAFEPLDVYWSVHNTATNGEPQDIDSGEIGTSFYRNDRKLFLLGMDGVDTEEFDRHVILHEWAHFLEDTLSRSDSIGGAHAIGDRLDMRVAFSEGFATAFAGMALASADYCDSLGPAQGGGFRIDIAGQATPAPGWYNEISLMKVMFNLWGGSPALDSNGSGFGPIYGVMTGAQANTPAFTSIFTFAESLKSANPEHAALLDSLLESAEITAAGIGPYGEGEQNDAGAPDVLPVYTEIVPDGSVVEVCSNSQFDPQGEGNKLSQHRFLSMSVDMQAHYAFSIVTTTEIPESGEQSDPDILIVRRGEVQNAPVDSNGDGVADTLEGFSVADNEEVFTTANELPADDYVMTLVEFRYLDDELPDGFPSRTCFDVSVSPAP